MTLPNDQFVNKDSMISCQCVNKNCDNCDCGCSVSCCGKPSVSECPFIKAHPNWQKCPFMSKMFLNYQSMQSEEKNSSGSSDHSACDSSKCSRVPQMECTSCHKTPALNHTVTLSMDTETATDKTEETVL